MIDKTRPVLVAGRITQQAANRALQGLQRSSPAITDIGWTNVAGDVVAHSYEGDAVRSNIADLPHFFAQRDSKTEKLFISPLYRAKAAQRWISSVSLRLNNSDGSFAGVVSAPLDSSYFARTYQSVNLSPDDVITVISTGGEILFREPFSEQIIGRSLKNTPLFLERLPKLPFGTFVTKSPIDGRERIFAYRAVSGLPLIMLVLQDRTEVLARWYEHTEIFGPLVALLTLVIILGTAALSRRTGELVEKSNLLEATLNNMHQGLIVVDQYDRIAVYNRRALELLDLPEDLLAAQPRAKDVIAYQAARGEFSNAPDSVMQNVLPPSTGGGANVYVRERPDGTILEIRTVPFANGGVVRTYRDITDWTHLDRELSRREKQFRLLADNATDIIARVSFDAVVLHISPSCASIVGYAPEEMLGRKMTDYIFEDDLAPTASEFGKIIKFNPPGAQRIEYRLRHKDGRLIWVESNPKLLLSENGAPLEIFDVIRDMTERKQIEQQLEVARQTAEDFAQAQAQFLATMSHELRTPLNSIIGFSEIVLDRDDIAPEVRRQIGLVQTASGMLLTVVNDVLDFSKIEEGQLELTPTAFEFRPLIDAVIAIVRGSAEAKNLELRVSIDPRISTRLNGDDQRIRQILINLLNNAIKFTQKGLVSLVAELASENETTQGIRFSILDTGIGIPPDKQMHLFQRFRQVDGSISREYGGSGLGLAISKRLVEIMGGTIGVDSTQGKGSTFWFALNLARGTEVNASPPSEAVAAPASARLLLVEDVEVNREIACAILEGMGYRVDAVVDGTYAIEAVQGNAYDLVLMDVQMPGMDGLTATRKIRALPGKAGSIPIVAMTANVLSQQIEATRSAGMNGHIGKPFKRDELRAEIERCLSETRHALGRGTFGETASAQIDEEAIATLTTLLGTAKVNKLFEGLKALLEQFIASDAAGVGPADLAAEAHRLVASAGMLGFCNLSQDCSRYERGVLDQSEHELTFDQIRDACVAALAKILHRLSGRVDVEEPISEPARRVQQR